MKKKLILLLTFIVTFIVSIDIVEAAEEMTCTYDYDPRGKKTSGFDTVIFEQNKKGDITVKINNKVDTDYKKHRLEYFGKNKDNYISDEGFKKCPPCAQLNTDDKKIKFTGVGIDKMCADYNPAFDNPVLAGRETSNTKWEKVCKYVNSEDIRKSIKISYNKHNFKVNSSKYVVEKYEASSHETLTKKAYPGFTLPELIKNGKNSTGELECPKNIFVIVDDPVEYGRITFKGCTSSNCTKADKLKLYDKEKEKEFDSDNYVIKEKNCVYKKNYAYGYNMIKIEQDGKGNRKYYRADDNPVFNEVQITKEEFNTSLYVDKHNALDDCPKCARIEGNKIIASDEIGTSSNGNVNEFYCLNDNDLPYNGLESGDYDNNDSTGDPLCDEKWDMVCKYAYNKDHGEVLILKFNESDFLLYRTGNNIPDEYIFSNISITKIQDIGNGDCPNNIYSKSSNSTNAGSMSNDKTTEEFYLSGDEPIGARVYTPLKMENCKEQDSKKAGWTISNCKDLFGKDLLEIIDKIMWYIKILVPILLLIFGTTDFFTAIFSNDQDEMLAKRKRFFKRLIAAIIVFIVPTFVNLILKLSNSVWSNIHEETCVDENDY